ncbi:MAG: NADH-quinone oxidoreductase subunit I [Thermodesulfobacteriota bacterium]
MGAYFSDIFHGLWSLLVGMSITFKEFFKPVVTVPYPYKTITMSDRYRGHIELIENEDGTPKCVACGMCQRGCPSGCISIATKTVEVEVEVKGEMKTKKKKVLTGYDLNFTTCSLCGQCVESCNFDAIEFSREYNLASTRKEDFHFDLLNRLKERNS